MSAQQYGMDPNEFAQAIDQQGQIPRSSRRSPSQGARGGPRQGHVTDTAGTAVEPRRARPAACPTPPTLPVAADADAADAAGDGEPAGSEAPFAAPTGPSGAAGPPSVDVRARLTGDASRLRP